MGFLSHCKRIYYYKCRRKLEGKTLRTVNSEDTFKAPVMQKKSTHTILRPFDSWMPLLKLLNFVDLSDVMSKMKIWRILLNLLLVGKKN